MTLRDIALIAARYDTSMSRAMMRALLVAGVEVAGRARRGRAASDAADPRYAGMGWCMRNRDEGSARGRA